MDSPGYVDSHPPPPTNQHRSYFTEAFWALFSDAGVLVALLTILIVAVLLPIAAHYVFAIWRLWKEERESGHAKLEEDEVVVENDVAVNEADREVPSAAKSKELRQGKINLEIVNKLNVQYSELKTKKKTLGIDEKTPPSFCPFGFGGFDIEKRHNDSDTESPADTSQAEPPSSKSLEEESARIADLVGGAKPKQKSKSKAAGKKKLDAETTEALKHLTESGLHGKLATAQLHSKTMKIESEMSEEERQHEREVRNQQLAAIFSMMQSQGDKFGVQSEEELMEQMQLYSV